MLHSQKIELIKLLNEFKEHLPPVEERKVLTNHYKQVEIRIKQAIDKLKDEDFDYVRAVNRKLLSLHMEGRLSMDEYSDLFREGLE